MLRGAELAVDEVNAAGGLLVGDVRVHINLLIDLIFIDHRDLATLLGQIIGRADTDYTAAND